MCKRVVYQGIKYLDKLDMGKTRNVTPVSRGKKIKVLRGGANDNSASDAGSVNTDLRENADVMRKAADVMIESKSEVEGIQKNIAGIGERLVQHLVEIKGILNDRLPDTRGSAPPSSEGASTRPDFLNQPGPVSYPRAPASGVAGAPDLAAAPEANEFNSIPFGANYSTPATSTNANNIPPPLQLRSVSPSPAPEPTAAPETTDAAQPNDAPETNAGISYNNMPNLERFNNENAPAANAPAANTAAANTPAANAPANAPANTPAANTPAANTPAANAPASANAPQEDSEFKKFLEELVERSRNLNRGDRIRYTYNDTDVNAIGKLFFDKNPGYVINMDDLSDLIRRISRLSLDTHPNKGGSQEKQQIVNDILTVLRALKRNENAANNSNSESNSNSLGEAEEAEEEAEQANASANAAEHRALELQEEADAAAAVAEANPDDAAAQDAASTAAAAAASALTAAASAATNAAGAAVELDELETAPSQNNIPALRNRVPPLRNIVPPLQPRSVSPSATATATAAPSAPAAPAADAPPANVNVEAETKKVIENLVKKSEDETETPFTPEERAEFDTLPNNIKTQYIAERNRLMFGNNIRTASQKKTPRWRGLMNNMKKQTGGMHMQERSVTPVGKGINMRVKKAPKKMSKKKSKSGKGKAKATRKL